MQANIPRAPAPLTTPISDTNIKGVMTGYLPIPWSDYFTSIDSQLAGSYQVLDTQHVETSSAAIGTTPITTQVLPAGLYRITYYLVELQAAGGTSSVAVTLGWTDRGFARTQTSPAMTGNSKTVALSNTVLVRIDASTALTYSTTYSSSGSPSMIYSLDILLEQVISVN